MNPQLTLLCALASQILIGVKARSYQKPEYSHDRTKELIGFHVYIEYLFYPGYWIVPWNYGNLVSYRGTINSLTEDKLFDPSEKALLKSKQDDLAIFTQANKLLLVQKSTFLNVNCKRKKKLLEIF